MNALSDGYEIKLSRTSFLIMIVLFSLLITYIFFVGVDKVISAILSANILILIIAITVYYLSLGVRSFRWKLFLIALDAQTKEKLNYSRIYSLITFSFALNNVFPLRMGELYRPYELSKRHNYSLMSSFATVILERTFDVMLMAALVISTGMIQGLGNMVNNVDIFGSLLLGLGITVGFIILLLFLNREETTYLLIRMLNVISGLIQKKIIQDEKHTAQMVASEVSSLIWNRRIIFLGCLLSLIIWLMEGFVFWTVAISMNVNLSFIMSIFILLLAGLIGNSITSASGLGQLPFMVAQLVLLVKLPQELALSVSLTYLLIVFWLVVPIGVILFELEKIVTKKA